MIPYGKQDISRKDIEEVISALKSDFLTQGPLIPKFEKSIAKFTNSKYCAAVNSATSALHIACLSLGVGKGDLVWTSPITYVASANAALYCGAEVDFVDIDPNNYNMCPVKLEEKLLIAKRKNCLPKVIMPVHLAGQSCNMQKISKIAAKYNIKIIEDASHAIGGFYKNHPIGSCKYSDIAVFSFHPVKIITTGEGGAITTNNREIFKKIEMLRTHGVTRNKSLMKNKPDGDWYYEQLILGFNYRITDIQAALGLSQIKRLKEFIQKRNHIAKNYNKLLKNKKLILPAISADCLSAFHLYVIRIKSNNKDIRKKIFDFLRLEGIGVNIHYMPVYKQPFYEDKFASNYSLKNAENYYSSAISIPMYPKLTQLEQKKVANKILEAVNLYC
tara:strand:- start:4201 stop:5364 length:1164 start_codon:yes stop_codon:yes gene_type:complete